MVISNTRNNLVVVLNKASSENKSLILEVIALAGNTGEEMWKRLFSPFFSCTFASNSYASPTPFFDGESIYVHFGNLGFSRLSTNGKTIWKRYCAVSSWKWIISSGPWGLAFISADGASDPSLYALNKKDGSIAWKKRRSVTPKNFSFCLRWLFPEVIIIKLLVLK